MSSPIFGAALLAVAESASAQDAGAATRAADERHAFAKSLLERLESNGREPHLSFAYENKEVEYRHLDREPRSGGAKSPLADTQHWSHALRFGWGTEFARGYLDLTDDEFEGGFGDNANAALTGAEVGLDGSPTVWNLGGFALFVPYHAFCTRRVAEQKAADSELAYVEFGGRIGIGADLWGLRSSVALEKSRFHGLMRLEGLPDATIVGTSEYFVASVEYRLGPRLPLNLRGDAYFGDLSGYAFSIAYRF